MHVYKLKLIPVVWNAIKRTSASQIQDLRKGVSNVNSVCVLILGGLVLMILSDMSSSYPLKRNNLDFMILSEHGGLMEPSETI